MQSHGASAFGQTNLKQSKRLRVNHLQDTRATLIKYVLRLVRCYLALDGPHATSTFEILQRLADSGVQSPPPNGPQRSEYTRNKFLTGLEKRINCARSNELRQEALDIIQLLEQEIVGWGFQFNLACLPGLWACSKAESLARLGKPVEADEVYYWPCAGAEQYLNEHVLHRYFPHELL
ncbi:hypothetical protein PtB15_15B405 [Puccinia triticina]|nr:hypothetical protein PtB15_15B405 [Puccinia triticina]